MKKFLFDFLNSRVLIQQKFHNKWAEEHIENFSVLNFPFLFSEIFGVFLKFILEITKKKLQLTGDFV